MRCIEQQQQVTHYTHTQREREREMTPFLIAIALLSSGVNLTSSLAAPLILKMIFNTTGWVTDRVRDDLLAVTYPVVVKIASLIGSASRVYRRMHS